MDGQRWWIIDEIARWWREAADDARFVLMQRAREGTPEATLEEVQIGAVVAETQDDASDEAHKVIEAWAAGKGVRRR